MTPHPDIDPETDVALGPLADDLASTALHLARRFAAGATLWCWAPERREHAQHVAVEFVHPVIVGKRALPAVAVTETGPAALACLRSLVRPGDVLLVVATVDGDGGPAGSGGSASSAGDGPAGLAGLAAVLRRAPSWGVTTVWIGAGARPAPGAADQVLWVAGDGALAAHDGRVVLAYHLLWELTHVCFEHPGLLVEHGAAGDPNQGPVCVTCSDEGRLGEVVEVGAAGATVRTATGLEEIDTALVGDLGPGDLVLVHAGTALAVVDPAP